MKHAATMIIAAALAVSVSGSANAGWGKFWKKMTDEKCWKISGVGKNNDYQQKHC